MPTITTTTTAASTTTTVHAACTTITITSDAGVTTTTISSIPTDGDSLRTTARSPGPAARARWLERLHPRRWLPRRVSSYEAPATDLGTIEPPAPTARVSVMKSPPPTSSPISKPEGDLPMPTSAISTPIQPLAAVAPPRGDAARAPENDHIQPSGDTMALLWREACAKYEQDTGHDLLTFDPVHLSAKDGILSFIRSKEDAFDDYRDAGPQKLRACLLPVLEVLGKLCEPIGGAVSISFAPASNIFSAIGIFIQAAIDVGEDVDTASTAFEAIGAHLGVIGPVADASMDAPLREATVQLLAQVLCVLGVITKLQKDGRLKAWLKNIGTSNSKISTALADLEKLATYHHQSVSAVTLTTSKQMLTILTDSMGRDIEEREFTRSCLAHIAQVAKDIYGRPLVLSPMLSAYQPLGTMTGREATANKGTLKRIENALARVEMADEIDRIIKWLGFPDSSVKVNTLLGDRVESTGAWFLNGQSFSEFKEGRKKFLLVHGKAGCGKSTLIAASTCELRTLCDSPELTSIVLSHLFDMTNVSQARDLRALLASMLCQLTIHHPDCVPTLRQFCADNSAGHAQAPLEGMRLRLMMILRSMAPRRVYLVIDALDEAEDKQVVRFVADLKACENVSLLVSIRAATTFRKELDGLCDAQASMDDEIVNTDIEASLDSIIARGPLASLPNLSEIREVLLARADGNFRWTVLSLRELEKVARVPVKVLQRLEVLPKSLEELYSHRLESVSQYDRDDVRRLLMWVILSAVHLSPEEFARLLSFDYSTSPPVYRDSLTPLDPQAVLSLVDSTFMSINGGVVRLAHKSVQDYLLRLPPDSPFHVGDRPDYCLMARTALAYIDAHANSAEGLRLKSSHHLAWSWVVYVSKAGEEQYPALQDEVLGVFSRFKTDGILDIALRTAAQIGHPRLVALLVDKLHASVHNRSERYGFTALHFAARFGHVNVVVFLLDRGADCDVRDQDGMTPLHCAASKGHARVVERLLHCGAVVNAVDKIAWTAAHYAANNGHHSVLRILLQAGAEVDARTIAGSTALHLASEEAHTDVIRLLVDQGASTGLLDADGRTPLDVAIYWREETAVRIFVETGAYRSLRVEDVDAKLISVGRWPGLAEDLAKDALIRDMLLNASATRE